MDGSELRQVLLFRLPDGDIAHGNGVIMALHGKFGKKGV